jgi:predicted alpha/beta-fold hydrolase
MPRLPDDFEPAPGLADGHAQTLFAQLARPRRPLPLQRRRLETPDGDFVDVDVLEGRPGAPGVVLLHGLEGSAASGYVQVTLEGCRRRGWTAWALNFRSCSGEPNRQAASYSSGDFRDLAWLLPRLPRPTFAVGFSLGGSVLLNFLARTSGAPLTAAVAVSAPYDLSRCADYLDSRSPAARVYRLNFLPTMRQKALEKAARFPGALDAAAVERAWTIRAFDDAVTARVYGYASAEAYYQDCSAGPRLAALATPTLLLSAEDDALAPARLLPPGAADLPGLEVCITRHGGHVGFVGGTVLRPRFWAEEKALGWLAARRW